ncbi:hypothetical protein [Oligoflexus tunisiensis]|uniref:hypothetical protein n=1 Tax=Oligoflexus tunisiensis TaxID=708132 RepID=UPI00114D0587|nr:hypothetical protein [Oligoflexus tunisiensis]
MILRFAPHQVIVSLALIPVLLGACVPGSSNKDTRQIPAAEERGGPANGSQDPDIEELGATDPVSIAGVNLVADFDNTRARCEFKNTADDQYEIFCRVTITSELGSEFIPLRIKPSLRLAWQQPVQYRGDFLLDRCLESNDHLSIQCSGELRSGTSALEFPLLITDSDRQQTRTERPEVLLPYFVGVIEGDFSDTHRSFTGLPELESDRLSLENQPVQAGFFRSKVERLDHKVNVQDVCDHEDLVIMASPTYIYIHDRKTDEVRPIAGRFDENVRFSYQFEDPMRLNHQTWRVVCGANGFTTFHANSGWDIDVSGNFSSALRALYFDYNGRLLRAVDTLTDGLTGRVLVNKTNRNLADLGASRQRISTQSNFDGENFVVVDVVKSADKLVWIASTYAPDKADAIGTRVIQTLDISAGDGITPGLTDPSVLTRFVRDRQEVLLYSGYCNYALYDLKAGRLLREVGPKKAVVTAPGSCADDTVVPAREFARFGVDSFIYRITFENWRTVDSQQQIRTFGEGTFNWTTEPVDLMKQGQTVAFDGRFPDNSRIYPLSGERMLVTNMEYLGLVHGDKIQLITANDRQRSPEVGRINNIFWESSTQRVLRIYNRTVSGASTAVVEIFQREQFQPFLEIPCSVIVGSGSCAEYIFKTGTQSASFLVTTPGPNSTSPDRSDVITYDAATQLVTNTASHATPRAYRYRNTRGESMSNRLILRHESQSTFMLFDTSSGVTTAITLPANAYLDSTSIYSISDTTASLDLLVANTFESDPSKSFSVYHLDLNAPVSTGSVAGLVSVPAAGSGNAALPYTTPEDGLNIGLNMGFQANAKAFDQQSNLYFYLPSAIYMAPRGSTKLVKLLDLESAPDCGGQAFQGSAKDGDLRVSLKTTMKNLCYNKTDGFFVSNGCSDKQGFINFFIRQYYGSESANLTLVTAPCTLLP